MLIHKPADDRCEHCARGKLRNLRKLEHAFQRPTARFGDIVTADHVTFAEEGGIYGLNGNIIALIIKDIFTGFLGAYPAGSKSADDTYVAIQHFLLRQCA